jgi:hypothetical protein
MNEWIPQNNQQRTARLPVCPAAFPTWFLSSSRGLISHACLPGCVSLATAAAAADADFPQLTPSVSQPRPAPQTPVCRGQQITILGGRAALMATSHITYQVLLKRQHAALAQPNARAAREREGVRQSWFTVQAAAAAAIESVATRCSQ